MINITKYINSKLQESPWLFSLFEYIVRTGAGSWLPQKFYKRIFDVLYKKREKEWKRFVKNASIPETASGAIRISINSGINENTSASNRQNNQIHRHIWVNGPKYNGMEDNDLRGFIDGRYKNAWNQPGQIHVRLGRVSRGSKLGEWELFRVLQRWDNLWLPKGAEIVHSKLELKVEIGVSHELEILLYEVRKDWNPGKGGINQNNNSTPAYGEVWWNEVGYETEYWGLPGAGFASDSHPNSDTPVTPLARAQYHPGDSKLIFESNELNIYVEKRIQQQKPLLFLLKLSDYLEDIQGTCISLYSANHGDSQNTARRPALTIDWKSSNATHEVERKILLEYNRSIQLPRIELDTIENIAVSHIHDRNTNMQVTTYIRGGDKDKSYDWQPIHFPRKLENWKWVDIRVNAHVNPVFIGQHFSANIKDTWVKTAPPEEQVVTWTFFSPSNKKYKVLAEYSGDYRWEIKFKPDELGRWQYFWTQHFIEAPYKSPIGVFDVIPGNRDNALQALKLLIEKIQSSNLSKGPARMYEFGPAFYRLQRALLNYETPDSYTLNKSSKDERLLKELFDKAREALSGEKPSEPRFKLDSSS